MNTLVENKGTIGEITSSMKKRENNDCQCVPSTAKLSHRIISIVPPSGEFVDLSRIPVERDSVLESATVKLDEEYDERTKKMESKCSKCIEVGEDYEMKIQR